MTPPANHDADKLFKSHQFTAAQASQTIVNCKTESGTSSPAHPNSIAASSFSFAGSSFASNSSCRFANCNQSSRASIQSCRQIQLWKPSEVKTQRLSKSASRQHLGAHRETTIALEVASPRASKLSVCRQTQAAQATFPHTPHRRCSQQPI